MFVLKVTDTSGQSSLSEIHVFVKPPTNKPPVGMFFFFLFMALINLLIFNNTISADAGEDMTVVLPKSTITVNGSNSTDDIKIVAWQWHKLK